MSNGGAVSQIYWPASLLDMTKRDQSGYVIGFNVNSFVVVVLGVRSVPTLSDARDLLQKLDNDPFVKKITEEIKSPRVLGYLRSSKFNSKPNTEHTEQPVILDKEADLWLLFDKQTHNNWPVLAEVYCYGFCYHPSPQIVFYEQPKHRTQMIYSTDDLPLFPSGSYHSLGTDGPTKKSKDTNDMELTLKQMQYSWYIEQVQVLEPSEIEKLGNPDDITLGGTFTNLITFIILCITLFRPAFEFLLRIFEISDPKPPVMPTNQASKTPSTKNPKGAKSPPTSRKYALPSQSRKKPNSPFELANTTTTTSTTNSTMAITMSISTVAAQQNAPAPALEEIETFVPPKKNQFVEKIIRDLTAALCYVISLSYTVKHLKHRFSNLLQWPSVWARREFVGLTWVHFYNQVLLLVVDLAFGILAGMVFSYYHQWFSNTAEDAHNWLLFGLQDGTRWLMGQPGGFKLNDQLDLFLGRLFLLYIQNWSALITYLSSFAPLSMRIAALSGLLGLSTMISIFVDFMQFLTMHVHWLYKAIAKAFFIQCRAVSSLWLLFRGKKRNVLKNRIDSVDYKPDQLLVGTLCFLVLCFLLPTTGVYYIFFLLFRFGTRAVIAAMKTVVILFTHFPLYHFILHFSKSPFLSGGIRFELCQNRMLKRSSHSLLYLKLKTNPKFGIGAFFSELVLYLKEVSIRP